MVCLAENYCFIRAEGSRWQIIIEQTRSEIAVGTLNATKCKQLVTDILHWTIYFERRDEGGEE